MVKTLLTATAMAALTSGAMAADLYVPPATPAMAPATTSWDGPYIGATVGYSWGTADATASSFGSSSISGFELGGQLGYNFHLADSIVLGIQGDLNWSNESVDPLGSSTAKFTTNWDGAVVGRLGVDMGEFLPYVEAGVAFAGANWDPDSATHTGWTVGAGVEFMLADNLSANVEARYADYGSATYGADSMHLTDTQFRVGLNYHF
ncbi:MAG: porin family protein [Devosia sp.]|nr:porin family protein [Devosia sp.]